MYQTKKKRSGERRKQVPFSIAIEKVELVQECFPKHLSMGTARIEDHEIEEQGKQKIVKICKKWVRNKERGAPTAPSGCISQTKKAGQGKRVGARRYCHLWVTYSSLQLKK